MGAQSGAEESVPRIGTLLITSFSVMLPRSFVLAGTPGILAPSPHLLCLQTRGKSSSTDNRIHRLVGDFV